jgi:hypothetical protein
MRHPIIGQLIQIFNIIAITIQSSCILCWPEFARIFHIDIVWADLSNDPEEHSQNMFDCLEDPSLTVLHALIFRVQITHSKAWPKKDWISKQNVVGRRRMEEQS